MNARAETNGRHVLAAATEAVRHQRLVVGVGLAVLALPFVRHGFELQVPVVWLLQFTVFPFVALHTPLARVVTSLLAGLALAWSTLALRVHQDPANLRLGWPAPDRCQVMAFLGFPIRAIGGHGGGGWRLFRHTWLDAAVHLGNVLLLAGCVWLLLGWLSPRARRIAFWCAFALLPIAFLEGGWRAMYYWD